ncbi:MAG: protein TolR [Candidatus Tectimicrobiota bacterium]
MSMGVGNKSQRSTLTEINVTPLVDVMLVLLIIFMITAPMMQQELDVNLPVAAGTPQIPASAEEPVVLTINKQGNIYLDQTAYTVDTLRAKLQAIYQPRRNKDIFLRADADVPYGKVIQVMDEVKKAGLLKVGMITQPPAEKR